MQCWGEVDVNKDWYRYQTETERAMNRVINFWSRERATFNTTEIASRSFAKVASYMEVRTSVCLNKNRHPFLLHCLTLRINFQKTLKNFHFLPLSTSMSWGWGLEPILLPPGKGWGVRTWLFSHRNWSCRYWCWQNRKKLEAHKLKITNRRQKHRGAAHKGRASPSAWLGDTESTCVTLQDQWNLLLKDKTTILSSKAALQLEISNLGHLRVQHWLISGRRGHSQPIRCFRRIHLSSLVFWTVWQVIIRHGEGNRSWQFAESACLSVCSCWEKLPRHTATGWENTSLCVSNQKRCGSCRQRRGS